MGHIIACMGSLLIILVISLWLAGAARQISLQLVNTIILKWRFPSKTIDGIKHFLKYCSRPIIAKSDAS